jgi:DNA ligase-associated metallophosphoesterase
MTGAVALDLRGQRMMLFAERAVFWEETRTLIVADAHLGKPSVLRAQGVPVPPGTAREDLGRLGRLLQQTRADRILFLGDLFHGPLNPSDTGFCNRFVRWRNARPEVRLVLIAGNHDPAAAQIPAAFGIDAVATSLAEGPFWFSHRPGTGAPDYNLAGHVHPAVRLRGAGRWSETLPCFVFGSSSGLLPAFGSFTGNAVVRPTTDDRIYAIAADEVVPI